MESRPVVRGINRSHRMFAHYNTSIQQRRAACSRQSRWRMPALPLPSLNGGYEANDDGAGRLRLGVRPCVNETRALIVAVIGQFGRSMSSAELCAIWDGTKPLQVIEYHLSTLVKAGVAEVVYGPELRFCLVAIEWESESHPSGAVPSALAECKRTEPCGSAGNQPTKGRR